MKNWIRKNLGTILIVSAAVPLMAFIAYSTYLEYDSCHNHGGALVRGVFGYECVGVAR